ncbi:class I SAM-dependent methyltransferase [Paludisphaera borealis]|uniref:S-adenosyl-L-methionine-dependent methyltransferase n=1 Tax=Paludisphaera borealis TaxID=1387353 RepID=A0A1U7CRC9_9BACT|nr:class I SAM-dependent methyltransferase [Paludisphaera borealis]APW61497.1 Putative S-adenosyl-L-methionine-dependent methyltransferase [Paludisphaera borealis]
MGTLKVELTKEKETLLITLFAKAMDSRAADSILGDRWADEAVGRLDYDFAKLKIKRDETIGIAMRAKHLDRWTSEFLVENPRGIVLNLGCGLDSRVYRLDPPAAVRWFDVDFPEVVELRRRLYPDRAGGRLIGTSVTDPNWIGALPSDGPALIVAEGLMPYLEEDDLRRLLERLTTHFPTGVLAFDGYSRLGLRFMKNLPCIQATGATFRWGIDDPCELEAMIPRLKLVEETAYYNPSVVARMSWTSRLLIRVWSCFPALRRIGRLLRYRF